MATLTMDKPCAAEEAKAQVMDAVEEAKRAVAKGKMRLDDMRDEAQHRIKKAPFMSVGIALGAGLFLGAILGTFASRSVRRS